MRYPYLARASRRVRGVIWRVYPSYTRLGVLGTGLGAARIAFVPLAYLP